MDRNLMQEIKLEGESICGTCLHKAVCRGVKNQPCVKCNQYYNIADAAPVLHSQWILKHDLCDMGFYIGDEDFWACNSCGFTTQKVYNKKPCGSSYCYCPHCGAKMDLEG